MHTIHTQRYIISLVIALSVLVAAIPFGVFAAMSTEVVSDNTSLGENQPGWLFNRDLSTQSPYEFNTDQAQIGTGALYVLPITNTINGNSDKFIAEFFPGALAVADLTTFSYDFLIGNGGVDADENQFYLNVYANFGESDDNKFYDCRYNVVPSSGSVLDWTTVTFDPTQAYPVTTRGGASASPYSCPAVPADMDTLSPGSNIRVFALNVGDTSASDQDLDGYFDNVVLTTVTDMTTFDFDPAPAQPVTKVECMNDGYLTFGFKNQGQCVRFVETEKDSR